MADQGAPKFRMVIDLKEDGGVSVNGPLVDKILCYGMLECARQLVENYKPSPIVVPHPIIDTSKIKGN